MGDVISASSREQTNESLAINWISGLFDISIEESQTYISMFDFMVLEYLIFAVKELFFFRLILKDDTIKQLPRKYIPIEERD